MKIGVIGGGTVGRATARCFLEHANEVRIHDVIKERSTHSRQETLACDFVFVCLPTPRRADGDGLDTRWVQEFFAAPDLDPSAKFVLRSTVPIGTTLRLAERFANIAHSPEFLTARCALTDAQCPSRMLIGNPRDGVTNDCVTGLQELYARRFPGVPVYVGTSNETEAAKLILNSFFACKVAFFNEARALCDARGLDWNNVLRGVLSDGRVAHAHTAVPGPDGQRGFGGTCLPKDLSEFARAQLMAGLAPRMADAAMKRNLTDREHR